MLARIIKRGGMMTNKELLDYVCKAIEEYHGEPEEFSITKTAEDIIERTVMTVGNVLLRHRCTPSGTDANKLPMRVILMPYDKLDKIYKGIIPE